MRRGPTVTLDGTHEARVLVGADGAHSIVRHMLGMRPGPMAVALRGYAPTPQSRAGARARAAVAALVDDDPERHERDWHTITRRYRVLTAALLTATRPRSTHWSGRRDLAHVRPPIVEVFRRHLTSLGVY